MSGFSNPVTDALGTLVRALMKSVNYIAGVAGWMIARNGDAEFNNGLFRGTVTVTAPNGSQIVLDANNPQPTITFYSPDHTNTAFINAPNGGNVSVADLGLNSGLFTPADGIQRRTRLFFVDSIDITQLAVVKSSNQAIRGGAVTIRSIDASIGYQDVDAALFDVLTFDRVNGWNINSLFANGNRALPYFLYSYNPFTSTPTMPAGAPTGTETVLATIGSNIWKTHRVYRVRVRARWSHASGTPAGMILRLRKGTTTGGALFWTQEEVVFNGATSQVYVEGYFANYTGADITTQIVLTGQTTTTIAVQVLTLSDGSGRWHVDFDDAGDTISWTNEPPIT